VLFEPAVCEAGSSDGSEHRYCRGAAPEALRTSEPRHLPVAGGDGKARRSGLWARNKSVGTDLGRR
jgi:hypothetical protein